MRVCPVCAYQDGAEGWVVKQEGPLLSHYRERGAGLWYAVEVYNGRLTGREGPRFKTEQEAKASADALNFFNVGARTPL